MNLFVQWVAKGCEIYVEVQRDDVHKAQIFPVEMRADGESIWQVVWMCIKYALLEEARGDDA